MDFTIYKGCGECKSNGWIWKRDDVNMTASRVQCPKCLAAIESIREFAEWVASLKDDCLACNGKGFSTYKVEGADQTVNLPCELCCGQGYRMLK